MRLTNRDRVQRHIELILAWDTLQAFEKDAARRQAKQIVDGLMNASASGKAVERFVKMIEKEEVA